VRIYFSLGDGLVFFHRFTFYIDDKGIQDIRGDGRKKFVFIGLRDLSYKLRKTDEARDWTSPAVFTYSVVCDKTQTDKSLLHGIAKRAGLSADDIDCSTIPVTLPYIRLRRNIWAELSSMATAYRCHLECAVEKPLVFAHSPYQVSEQGIENSEQSGDYSYCFKGEDIFYLRKTAKADYYRNTVRLKVNMPVSLERQEIWRYDEPPVFYDDLLKAYYPFKSPLVREIEISKYEAKYRIIDEKGKERNVVFADEIDTQDEADNRLLFNSEQLTNKSEKNISYSFYDVSSHYDKAVLTLHKESEGNLYNTAIYGRSIVLDLNRSSFMRDMAGVETYGTVALNVTGSYFSEYLIGVRSHYEDWVVRELARRIQNRREITVKTHRVLFHGRIGAQVKIKTKNEELSGTVSEFSLKYRRDHAFIASFKILEGIREGN